MVEENEQNGKITINGYIGEIADGSNPIPLGKIVEVNEQRIPIPLCQTILSAVYQGLSQTGFTDFFGLVRSDEKICINQGTRLAREIKTLNMNATICAFNVRVDDEKLEVRIVGLDRY